MTMKRKSCSKFIARSRKLILGFGFFWLRAIWIGFWIQIVSGSLLLIAYPTKALTNPDFYLKLTLIAVAVVVMQRLKSRVFEDSSLNESKMMLTGRALAAWSLILWSGAVTAGRLLAYTYQYLKYDYRG